MALENNTSDHNTNMMSFHLHDGAPNVMTLESIRLDVASPLSLHAQDSTHDSPNLFGLSLDDVKRAYTEERKKSLILEKKLEEAQQYISKLEEDIKQKDEKITQIDQECKKQSLLSWRTMNDKLKQDVEMEVWRRKFKSVQATQAEKDLLIQKKDQEIQQLAQQVLEKNEANYKMALKLLDYQTKVSSVELQLRKFAVKKINRIFAHSDVEITLTKNPANGKISLDIAERGKHTDHPLKDVVLVPGFENIRFMATYADGYSDTFESSMAQSIVTTIKEYLT